MKETPMSGWRTIKTTGTAMTAITLMKTLPSITSNWVSILARKSARGTLTNSENWKPIPPRRNQLLVPATVLPTTICSARMMSSAR